MKEIVSPFKFVESCLFHYLENLARIEALRDDLKAVDLQSSLTTQQYEERISSGGYIDNIPGRIMKMDMLESLIADLERWTNPVTRLLNDLSSPYNISPERQYLLEILRVRYIYGNTWERTLDYLKMRREGFVERRKQLVEMAIKYMGL